ncbi:hypothetical protein [Myceligenerans pegani]|uniref:Uncharacterized protein n=1 Tax=Myceligenerans pegani TaxID=2776917 RepID=A0ABR9MXN0_9MICO|nr:hypothetical protein [Myceligenerans sp. TRM 65318]MBE1875679.1 hypothetical protein [Myceligenerans sp. TRM 65318]MBE3017950.1 hypothetical protein [Myceligenerans sp. TRM 65318]
MTQTAQVGTVYQSNQELLDADLPYLSVAVDASGYAIQRDVDGNWYSVASVTPSDIAGVFTLIHLPADPLPATYGSVVIADNGTPFMRRWDARTDGRFGPEHWIGPDGATVTDAHLRRLGIARAWDAASPNGAPAGGAPSGGAPANSALRSGVSR